MNTRTAKGFICTNPDTDGLSGDGERERERDASFISPVLLSEINANC